MIVILTQDLMMSSGVSNVARNRGLEFKSATSVERVLDLARENSISILLIDLQHANLDIEQLLSQLSEVVKPLPRLIAYAQHVNVDLLSTARKAGIDEVFTRGQVNANLEALLSVN